MTSRRVTWASALALALALATIGPACGGATRDAESASAPASVEGFTFAFAWEVEGATRENGDARGLAEEVEAEVRRAGFTVVDEEAPHDAEIVLRLSIEKNTSIIVWKVDNKRIDDLAARARLRVRLDGATLLETEPVAFTFTSGEARGDADELVPLVGELARSRGLAHVARRLTEHRRDRVADADRAAAEEEETWRLEVLEPCREARGLADCQRLDDWMLANRRKVDVADRWLEAKVAREKAEPRLQAARDHEAWRGAGSLACEQRTTVAACGGVDAYLREHPGGLHATEGRALVEKVAAVQAADRARGEAEERREAAVLDAQRREAAAAEQARAAEQERVNRRAQCRGACRSSCTRFLDQATFDGCLATCLAECP